MSLRLGSRTCLARSAPRAHVRELLCGTQSSKERLRRSRTESSGAAPAIEELAGEARQVRPAGPRADQYQPGFVFSRAGRSGGSQALQLPRASNSCGSSTFHLCLDCAPQKSENSAPAPLSPIEEVWRESGPPAPPGIKFLRKFNIPPLPRLRPAEVGKFRPGTAFSHRRGLEGVRPSSSPGHQILAEVQHSTSASTAPRRSRKIPPRHRFLPSKRSGGSQALQLPWHQILADIRIPVRLPLFFLKTNRLEEEPPFA